MAIVHDAWLFDPRGFAESVDGYTRSVAKNPTAGYATVRDAVVATLDEGGIGWNFAERLRRVGQDIAALTIAGTVYGRS